MKRLIDADDLHKLFGAVTTHLLSKPELSKDIEHMVRAFIMTTKMIEDAPTVDAVPVRHGKWEYGEDESGYDGYYCSKCFGHVRWYRKAGEQSINFIKKYNYCPNCGARMDAEND